MGKIILNGTGYGGSGGSGGHTIVDPTGTDMPQEDKLQFTGNVSVSDDSANGQTVVNVEGGGNVYGAFVDTDRVITSGTYNTSFTYTATEDCFVTVEWVSPQNDSAYFYIDGERAFTNYASSSIDAGTITLPLKKGQVLTGTTAYNSTKHYKVYGVVQGTNGIYAPVIYSDTERVIGVWRDGKPLYQKTIDIAPLPNRTSKEIQLDADIERVISMRGYGIDANDKWNVFLNDVVPTNVTGSIRVFFNTATKKLYINTGENLTSYTEAYVTIQYTKTTDVAGSGNWNTDGVPTHHYSTNEQVIGTWIDGKPLYEKTFELTQELDLTQNTWVKSELDQGTMKGLYYVLFTNSLGACLNNIVGGFIDNKIAFNSPRTINLISSENTKVTLQYTKTTD